MSVSDGQSVNAAISNAAFVSRTANTDTTGKVDLLNTSDAASGSTITNIQRLLNGLASFTGASTSGAYTQEPNWSDNSVGTSSDNLEERSEALTIYAAALSAAKVTGPASATDNAVARFDATSGKVIQNSGVIVDDSNNVTGVNNLTVTGDLTVNGTTTTLNTATLDVEDVNITLNNGGNQATADDVAGITVEMSDADDGVLIYDKDVASKWKAGTDVTKYEILTASHAQDVANKDIDGGTASNDNRITIPKNTKTNLDSLTRKEATLVYATDESAVYIDDGATLIEVGAGGDDVGGINYNPNHDIESSAAGYSTYADAAATSPVDGFGGSPTVTITRSTSSPLRGVGSLLLTKDAANRQGEGASVDLTEFDAADWGKVVTVSMDYGISSGTYADDDVSIWLYDTVNSVLIQPSPSKLKKHTLTAEKFYCEFQSATTSGSYRLIWHVASTSASAYVLKFDNIIVGPSAKLYGSPLTDWVAWTPTGSWSSNTTYTGFRRRVGDCEEFQVKVATSGAPTSANLTINLPVTIDTNKLTNSTASFDQLGLGSASDSGTAYKLHVNYNSTTSVIVSFQNNASGAQTTVTQAAPFTFGASDYVIVNFKVPVVGYSSSMVMSSDASTRVIAARYELSASTSIADGVVLAPTNKIHDTHGAFNTSNGRFTCPVPGIYEVAAGHRTANNASGAVTRAMTLTLRKNGSANATIAFATTKTTSSTPQHAYGTAQVQCIAGDYLEVFYNNDDGTINSSATQRDCFISFKLLTGPAQIASSETVASRHYASSTAITGSLATIVWTTTDYDTHGAVASGVFTCPIAGKYRVTSALALSGTFVLNNTSIMEIQKNGTAVSNVTKYAGGAITNDNISIEDTINCIAGDTLRIQVSNSGTTPAVVSSNTKNYLSIARVGL